jgi:hypothetical protein
MEREKIEGGIDLAVTRWSLSQMNTNERYIQMKGTYKVMGVSPPGILCVLERPISEPGAGQVRIRVEA